MRQLIIALFCLCVSLQAQVDSDFESGFEDEFSQESDYDPLEGYNRFMTKVNDKIYVYALNPITKGYKEVTPYQFRDRVSDFFHNILYPIRLVNNVLQGKVDGAVVETGRFLVNTTFGVGGLFDAATAQGIKRYDEDFGQTLGYYGVPKGFHIVLPVVGPSNLRDFSASFIDGAISPLNHTNAVNYEIPDNSNESFYLHSGRIVNDYSYKVDNYDLVKKNSVDFYLFMKDMYETKREKMIKE